MPETVPVTVSQLIARHAAGIASIVDEQPATTLTDFADQLRTAAVYLDRSGINGGDELDMAALYLVDAEHTSSADELQVLAGKAAEYLKDADDIVAEYRLA